MPADAEVPRGGLPAAVRAVVAALGMAAAYFALGKACYLLAVPPLFACPVWLPAGMALAAVLLWGWRVAAGVLLGAFALRMDVAFHQAGSLAAVPPEGMVAAAITGCGALLQACVGAWAVRRWVGPSLALKRGRDILRFLALASASCLVNAGVSLPAMGALGLLRWQEMPLILATWCLGDIVGVFVMAPLVFALFAAPRDLWRRRIRTVALPLLLAVAVLAGGFAATQERNVLRDRAIFERNAKILMGVVADLADRDPAAIPGAMAYPDARKFAWLLERLPAGGGRGRAYRGTLPLGEGASIHPWRVSAQWRSDDASWRFQIEPTAGSFPDAEAAWPMWGILAGGAAGVGLLGAFLLLLTGHTQLVEAEVADRTVRLARMNVELGAQVADRRRAEEEVRILARELEKRVAERTAQLESARIEAESANRAKSAFLANISHEVRTPMNGILGIAEVLRGTPLDARQRALLGNLGESGESLMRLLDTVLDLSKIEAGRMAIESAPFSLRGEVAQAVGVLSGRAAAKGLVLCHRVDDAVPDALAGDAFRLRQILLNLVGNAVKFTDHGSVEVRVEPAGPSRGDGIPLCILVADTGIGLPPDQIDTLFHPFAQGDASITRKYGGSGLGLAICARLAELMGGTLRAENRAGGGSVFTLEITLRLAAAAGGAATRPAMPGTTTPPVLAPPPPVSAPAPPPVPASHGRRVLVVEDNRINQIVIENLLTPRGHRVTLAAHGGEALDALAREDFDLVLMDIQMPVMDGFEALRRIRAEEAATGRARRRVVALTASAMRGDREICLAAGMDGYLSKPIQPEALYAAVER